jgi:hypothetical protein
MSRLVNTYYVFQDVKYVRRFDGACKVSTILERLRGALRWKGIDLTGGHLQGASGEVAHDDYIGPGDYNFVGFAATASATLPSTTQSAMESLYACRWVTSSRTDEIDDFRINIHYSYNRKGYRRRLVGQERTAKVSLILESVRGAFRWQNVEFVGGHLVDGSGATICSDKLEPGDYWFVDFEPVPSGALSDTPDTCIVT